jgi:anti-anti-sigma factor
MEKVHSGRRYAVHLVIDGSIDNVGDCQGVVAKLKQALVEPGQLIVLDFRYIPFVTGSFIGFLISGIREVRMQGGDLLIVTRQPEFLELLKITGVSSLLRVLPEIPADLDLKAV